MYLRSIITLLCGAVISGGAIAQSALTDVPSANVAAIHEGMGEAEVTKLLGAPKSRSVAPWGDVMVIWDAPKGDKKVKEIRVVFDTNGTVTSVSKDETAS